MADEPGTSREAFLNRISDALGREAVPSEAPDPPVVGDAMLRLAGRDADVLTMFAENAAAVGADVRRCGAGDLDDTLIALMGELGVKTVVSLLDVLAEADSIHHALGEAGISRLDWRHDTRMTSAYQADAGLTGVHAALAETGTLICNSDAAHARGASLAPPVHVAIVRGRDVLPDLLDYLPRLEGVTPAELPSSQVLITGPSKTADIEGVLITGVHGPGKLIIVLVEDL